MKDTAQSILGSIEKKEPAASNKEKLAEIRVKMDEVSDNRFNLNVEKSLSLIW
jgi:hypothetical protein